MSACRLPTVGRALQEAVLLTILRMKKWRPRLIKEFFTVVELGTDEAMK